MVNYVGLFRHPRNTVKAVIEEPNLVIAGVMVLLPTVLSFLVVLVLGFGFQAAVVTRAIADLVLWIVSGIVLYILLYLIKGKEVKDKFTGLISGTALVNLVSLVMLVVFLVLVFVIAPGFFPALKQIDPNTMSKDEMLGKIMAALEGVQADNLVTIAVLFLGLIIEAVLILFALYVFYQVIEQAEHASKLKNLITLILFIVIALFLQAIIVF